MEEANPSEKDSSLAAYLLAFFHLIFEGRNGDHSWNYLRVFLSHIFFLQK